MQEKPLPAEPPQHPDLAQPSPLQLDKDWPRGPLLLRAGGPAHIFLRSSRRHGEHGCLFSRTNIFSRLQQAGLQELAPTRKQETWLTFGL